MHKPTTLMFVLNQLLLLLTVDPPWPLGLPLLVLVLLPLLQAEL
jgi:hypothetical protein